MEPHQGNELLDEWLGLELRVIPDGTWDALYESAEALAVEYERGGAIVYRMPIGGSSALGAYAFLKASEELKAQCTTPFDSIVFASSSGSTHTGLAHGFRSDPTTVLGIACDPEPDIAEDFAKLSEGLSRIDGAEPLEAGDYELDFRFVGPGYGVPSDGSVSAIRTLARSEGIFLDPIYSGKAFHGLLSRISSGETGGRVLFWHTGGVPSLFAMPKSPGYDL